MVRRPFGCLDIGEGCELVTGIGDGQAGPGERPARQQTVRWSAGSLVAVINGILVGVGGVFLATASLPVTCIAAGSAILLAGVIVLAYR